MRKIPVLAAFVTIAACVESTPPPQDPTQAQHVAEAQQAAAYEQQMTAANAAQARAAEEQQRQIAADQAHLTNVQQSSAKAVVDERTKKCDDSREARVTHAKQMLAARLAAETRVLKHAKALRESCKLTSKKTGAISVRSDGSGGFRVAPELRDDVQCSKLPGDLTKDDAYVILFRVREFGEAAPKGSVLELEDRSPDDDTCESLDKVKGIDFRDPRWEDQESIKRASTWGK